MLLLDLSHTSHTTAQTGIQRVCRSLFAELKRRDSNGVLPITYDPYHYNWRGLVSWEFENLNATTPARTRGSQWPLAARFAGRARHLFKSRRPQLPASSGLIVPEVFSAQVAAHLPELFATVKGPRIALFHDAIALKFPELTPNKTVARFPAYLRELLAFDGIAAVSEDSRASLVDYWKWLGVATPPPVQALPLPLMSPVPARPSPVAEISKSENPVVLCVGSIEGRKNHLALLEAAEQLWARGRKFSLRLIGLAQPQTGRPALERVRALQSAGRPLRYDGPVDAATLESAYAECTFTVYPSLIEGFGLPVLESLAHQKPCICSSRGALGESARGGGCQALDDVSASALATAIEALLTDPALRSKLVAQAGKRVFRTWSDFTSELTDWSLTLPRREG